METKSTKGSFYDNLLEEASSLIERQDPVISVLANVSSLLWERLPNVNWLGFYLLSGKTLFVGPFQGKPACVQIDLGRGVCGKAASLKKPIVVDDVDRFPGYIACNKETRSELVIPILYNGVLKGVLDIDSPLEERFEDEDVKGLTAIVNLVATNWDGKGLL